MMKKKEIPGQVGQTNDPLTETNALRDASYQHVQQGVSLSMALVKILGCVGACLQLN